MRNEELGIRNYSSMRTNSVLTPCKVRYFHVTPIPDNKLQQLLRSLVSGGSLRLAPTTLNPSLKLRTNTANLAQSRWRLSCVSVPLSYISVPLRHFLSDPRAQVARPAPAGHATRARRSRDPRPRVAGLLGGGNGNCGNKNENRGTLFCRSVSLRRNVPHLVRKV